MSAELPSGFDRADGLSGRPGTPTPKGAVVIQSRDAATLEGSPIEEEPDSPVIERAEQATISQRFRLPYLEGQNRIRFLGRGTVRIDSFNNVTKILSSKLTHAKPGLGYLDIVSEGVSFDSPPDDFKVTPVQLGVSIVKHPRYFSALDGSDATERKLNQSVIVLLQNYFENPSPPARNGIVTTLLTSIGHQNDAGFIQGTDLSKRAALEIIQKYWRGEETPYVVGYEVRWSVYYFRPQFLNPGGYVEDPIFDATPQLPVYFWSPTDPPNPTITIFDRLAAYNPQCYSDDGTFLGSPVISWMRQADDFEYQRTWFRVDRTWIGSPVGFWDVQLYSGGQRPLTPDQYVAISDALQ